MLAGYLPEHKGFALEFVQKARPPSISLGSGFRHFSVAVPSIEAAISRATDFGLGIVEGKRWEKGEVYIRVHSHSKVLISCMAIAEISSACE
jgi:hypothetical protein